VINFTVNSNSKNKTIASMTKITFKEGENNLTFRYLASNGKLIISNVQLT
jgi:hypothetical protein